MATMFNPDGDLVKALVDAVREWFRDKYQDFENPAIKKASLSEQVLISALGALDGEAKPSESPSQKVLWDKMIELRKAGKIEEASKVWVQMTDSTKGLGCD